MPLKESSSQEALICTLPANAELVVPVRRGVRGMQFGVPGRAACTKWYDLQTGDDIGRLFSSINMAEVEL